MAIGSAARPHASTSAQGETEAEAGTSTPHVDVAGPSTSRAPRRGAATGREFYVQSFQAENKARADVFIRRLFYRCDLPFHLAKTPAWGDMVENVAAIGASYRGPSMESLRTTHLMREVQDVTKELEPVRESWKQFGCTIMTDGWSDTRRRHIINILVSSCVGTMFLRAIDTSAPGTIVSGE